MRRGWAVGLLLISILAIACGGAASVDEYKAAFVYVGPADDGGWSQAHDVGRQFLVDETGIETAYTELIPEDATDLVSTAPLIPPSTTVLNCFGVISISFVNNLSK